MSYGIPTKQPEPGDWTETLCLCPVLGTVRATHSLPERELGLHLIDVAGECSCEPEDALATDPREPPIWIHKELTYLT